MFLILGNCSLHNVDCLTLSNKNLKRLNLNSHMIKNIDLIINYLTNIIELKANNNKKKEINLDNLMEF